MPVVLATEPFVEVVEEAPEWQSFEVTAYTAGYESTGKRPGEEGYGITTSGDPVREGITVACPPSMAFGTRLEIEGIGVRVCTDRGGAIKEGRLDIYIPKLEEAQAFGRQWLRVRIMEAE
jgi:3D (Asp-Asp-Asp) domain-containing protein